MSDGFICLCTRSLVHNTAVVEKPAVGRYEYFNNRRRTNTKGDIQAFSAQLLRETIITFLFCFPEKESGFVYL